MHGRVTNSLLGRKIFTVFCSRHLIATWKGAVSESDFLIVGAHKVEHVMSSSRYSFSMSSNPSSSELQYYINDFLVITLGLNSHTHYIQIYVTSVAKYPNACYSIAMPMQCRHSKKFTIFSLTKRQAPGRKHRHQKSRRR
jgi:hypothetical protein